MSFSSLWRITRLLNGGGCFFLVFLLSTGSHAAPVMDFEPPAAGTYKLHRIQPASQGWVLDASGKRRKLSRYTQGKVTLLAFMYSSCADPNGCPYALTVMHLVKSELEKLPQTKDKVRFVSLSFDPVRDTPQVLALYGNDHADTAQHLDWDFLTTRSRRELVPILNGFGQDVGVDVDKQTRKPLGSYSHVLKVFLIDRQSKVREIYTTDYLLPAMVLNDIKTLLIEDRTQLK